MMMSGNGEILVTYSLTESSGPEVHGNKDRLYIAYYATRSVRNAGDFDVDTALLVAPKKPRHATAIQSWKFCVSKAVRGGHEWWEYDGRPCENRSPRLVALLLLGKLEGSFTGATVRNILSEVLVVQNEELWGCRHWTRDAIQTLIEHEVITPPAGGAGAREIWLNGRKFAREVNPHPRKPVPTCNQMGKAISSEIK